MAGQLVDHAAAHDEGGALQFGDVGQRALGHGDDVGALADALKARGANRADEYERAAGDTEQHHDDELSTVFVEELGIPRPEIELGIHQISEILPVKGVKLAGPLPAELQKYTVYVAVPVTQSAKQQTISDFIRHLSGPTARERTRSFR